MVAHISADVRRKHFIEAAVAVIARDGVDGATTRKIAAEAGAPLATLHYCFQTKENLLWAVFEELSQKLQVDYESVIKPGQSAADVASTLLVITMKAAIDDPTYTRAQLEIGLWAGRNDQPLAIRVYDEFIETWKGFLRGARGSLEEEQLDSIVRVFVALVDGLTIQLVTDADADRTVRDTETAAAMLSSHLKRSRRAA